MPGTDLAAQVCYHPTPPHRVPCTDLAADDSSPRAVATCRQTVEAFLTPPQRVPDTISTPRPYEPNRSWKSKIPHNLEDTNSIYPGRFAEAIAAANICSVGF
jgi:hypothetical protein